MHTRSTKNKVTGKFTVTVTDWNGVECFRSEFADVIDAERAAQREERAMMLRMQQTSSGQSAARYFDTVENDALSLDEILMSDDDLLRELGA
jgi:hypothetical protein